MIKEQGIVITHLKNKNYDDLKIIVNGLSINTLRAILREILPDDRIIVFEALKNSTQPMVFDVIDIDGQKKIIMGLPLDMAVDLLEELKSDTIVKLFGELSSKTINQFLLLMSKQKREDIELLRRFNYDSAGRIMSLKYVNISKDITVGDALEFVRKNSSDTWESNTIYVTDENKFLVGSISLMDLIIKPKTEKIETVMNNESIYVYTSDKQEKVVEMLEKFGLSSIPVVNPDKTIIGTISIDKAIHITESVETDEILDKAGLKEITDKESDRSNVLIHGSLWSIWKVRIPYLIVTLFGGLLAGSIVGQYEDVLSTVAAVAFFIPVIMDMGGNAGTQSSTIFARAFLLGHIKPVKFFKALLKEVWIGLSMGIISGIIGGVIVYFWQGTALALAIGLSLATTMSLATLIGFLVPYVLWKVGLDQAAGADPIITTIKDISGLLIYFSFAVLFLSL